MKNEDLILQKLEFMEAEIKAIRETRLEMKELVEDMSPLMKSGFQHMLAELGKVDHGFQLEDSFLLMKRFLRNMKHMAYLMDQMENAIEFVHTMEPMAKSAMHQGIRFLGELEQKGVFRTYEAMLDVRAKVAQQYGPEDIEEMSDNFVQMLGLLKKLATPEFIALMEKMAELPKAMELDKAEPVGPVGMIKALQDPDLKEGLGVGLQMAKALKTLK